MREFQQLQTEVIHESPTNPRRSFTEAGLDDPTPTGRGHGGTAFRSLELGVDGHSGVKTIVMQDERKQPLIALMHGDMNVSARNLGRCIGAKTIEPCDPVVAQRQP